MGTESTGEKKRKEREREAEISRRRVQSQAEKLNPEIEHCINEPNVGMSPSLNDSPDVKEQVEDHAEHENQPRWPSAADDLRQKNIVIVTAAAFILGLAYQAAVSPPGGVSQENERPNSTAGHVVIGYTYPNSYIFLVLSNAVALSLALLSIFLVACGWTSKTRFLFRTAWGSICVSLIVVAANYAVSVIVIAPRKSKSFMLAVLLCTFLPAGVVLLFLILIMIHYFDKDLFTRLRRLFDAVRKAVFDAGCCDRSRRSR